jgi:hypothetical protein
LLFAAEFNTEGGSHNIFVEDSFKDYLFSSGQVVAFIRLCALLIIAIS